MVKHYENFENYIVTGSIANDVSIYLNVKSR